MDRIERIAMDIVAGAKVVYSAVLIDETDRKSIVENARHKNLYGDHVTLWYYGGAEMDTPYAGERVELNLTRHFADDRGEAWLVSCGNEHVREIKEPSQVLHVTVSCADGTKPVYSNELVRHSFADETEGFPVHGRIAYYMTDGTWFH